MTRNHALVDVEALTDLFPHRVARAADLVSLGFTANAIYRRCRPGGSWQRVAPGVILLSNAPPTRPQLITAALKHAGSGAVVTGWDALARHGMSAPPGPAGVHILVPHNRQVRNTGPAVIERTTRMPDPVLCKGFPIAPLPRATLDTARRLTSTDLARALIAEIVHRGGVTPAALRHELEAGSRRGAALPRRALDEVSGGVRSLAQSWARRLVHRAGLPLPRWNCPIRAPDGDLLGIVGAWWDDVGLAWEFEPTHLHPSPAPFEDTIRRRARLTSAGIVVLNATPGQLRTDSVEVVTHLRQAHKQAAARPRPPVTAGMASVC